MPRSLSDRSCFELRLKMISLALLAVGACSDATGPRDARVTVTVKTTGVDRDHNGYTVTLAGVHRVVSPAGTASFEDVLPGKYELVLGDLAFNCTVAGETTREVVVSTGESKVAFAVECAHTPQIAFVSDMDGSVQIYAVRPDGSGLRKLTNTIGTNYAPTWSPDGARLAFISTRNGNAELYVMDATGESVQRLTNTPGAEAYPVWSPDGSELAYSSGSPATLFVVGAWGSTPLNVSNDAGRSNVDPTWSPDGRRIAYTALVTSSSPAGSITEVRVVNADGSNRRLLTSPAEEPRWSPDGRKIAFRSAATLGIVNPDGTGKTILPTRPYPWQHVWAGNSQELAYASSGINIINVASGQDRRLTPDGLAAWQPAWAAYDSRVFFTQFTGGVNPDIAAISTDGTGLTVITPYWTMEQTPTWRP